MAPVDTAPSEVAPKIASGVKIDIKSIKVTKAPPSKRYWVGVMPDAPFDIDSRGGVGVCKFKGRTPVTEAGRIDLTIQHELGDVLELTDSQIELFKARVANVVLRVGSREDVVTDDLGNKRRVSVPYVVAKVFLDSKAYDVNLDRQGKPMPNRPYQPKTNDVPLGYYLYCVPLSESMPLGWRTSSPPRMCDVASMVSAV